MGMHIGRPSWFLRLAGGLMTGNIAMAGAQTVDGVDISDLASKVGRIKVGTYTGDGAATQAITGVGFRPEIIMAVALNNGNARLFVWTAGCAADFSLGVSTSAYLADHIKGDGPDGFTIGDGTGDGNFLNVSGRPGIYICFKQVL